MEYTITNRGKQESVVSFNEKAGAVLDFFQEEGRASVTDTARIVGLNTAEAQAIIRGFCKERILEPVEDEGELSETPRSKLSLKGALRGLYHG